MSQAAKGGSVVPFNLQQRRAALRRQLADMELRRRTLGQNIEHKQRELAEIEQQIAQHEGAEP